MQVFQLLKSICPYERKNAVYIVFIDLENLYDSANREALWQVLGMYDVGGKLLIGIKSMYIDSSACVRVNGGESEWFRIDSGVRQGCIMSPWLFNIYMDRVIKEIKMGMGRRGEGGDCLASFMQITLFYVVRQSRT